MFFLPLRFIFIYLFLAALGLSCICSEWQLVFVAWIFLMVASLVVEQRL